MKTFAFSVLFTFMCFGTFAQWTCGTLGALVMGDTVVLSDDSCWRNCGSFYIMTITANGNNLVWTQHDKAGGAFCDCPFNLFVTVANLQPGMYNTDVYCTDSKSYTIYVGSISFNIAAVSPPDTLSVFNPYQSTCLLMNTDQPPGDPAARSPAYPNPFRDKCLIRFDNRGHEQDQVMIYNTLGVFVRKLSIPSGGQGSVVWDGRNSAGLRLAPGTYFYRLQSGNAIFRSKLILM